jgi:hypothetical protein
MAEPKKPTQPVKPSGMEILLFYPCPNCERQVPLIGPTQPSMAQCDACRAQFPIVPADERTIQFIKLMLANGRAGIDPDFL